MTLLLLIAAVWLAGAITLVACCRVAARGDEVLSRALRVERDSHEFTLAA